MTVPVALDQLRDEVERFGAAAFLLTVSDDGRPHAVSAVLAWAGSELSAVAGRRTSANATARPMVTLLWPPHEPGGYNLIVDGDATVAGDTIIVAPTKAVLHRSAPAPADGPAASTCGSDCIPLNAPEVAPI